MPAVPTPAIDASILTTEAKSALAILQNLSAEQVSKLQQQMQLEASGTVDLPTLTALVQFCKAKGIDLSTAGVNAFKTAHGLGNTGAYQGVIGAQTAQVYFKELSQAGTRAQSKPAPAASAAPTADLNQAILAAAQSLLGMCTTDGPDGGNNACAWSVNQVLKKAGISALGENPNYVPSLVEALQNGRGRRIDRANAKAGDLVVAFEEAHIGIGLDKGCATVLSNSSSRGRFQWQSDTDFDGYYGGQSAIYRLVK